MTAGQRDEQSEFGGPRAEFALRFYTESRDRVIQKPPVDGDVVHRAQRRDLFEIGEDGAG